MSSASDVDTGDEFSALGHPNAGRPVLRSAGGRQPHLGSSSIGPTRPRSYDKQLDLPGLDEKMPQNNQNDDSRLPQRTAHNLHNDAWRRQSRKPRRHRTNTTHRKSVDVFSGLLPESETEELEKKSIGKRRKEEKRDVRESRSDKSRKSISRSKDAMDIPGLVEIPTEKADLESIMSGDDKVQEATMPEFALNVATGAQVIIKLPIKVLAILMELNLLWWFIQLFLFVWMTTCVDYQLRLRAPIAEFPGYSPLKMPWLPSQLNMRSRLLAAWLTLAFVYLPLVIYHMSRFYDSQPKTRETKIYTKRSEARSWYLSDRYTHLQEPKEGQPFNLLVFLVSLTLWLFYLIVFLSDAFYPMQDNYWHRTIDKWLYELQRNYFLEFKALAGYIKQEERLQAYHTPDNGKTPVLIMDLLQSMFECCGRTAGYKDWNSPHVYRPKNHTYRKALGIPILNERAYYLLPTLTNRSVPFSCCRWKHQNQALAHVACDHINLDDPSTVFKGGCVQPLTRFIQLYWMEAHLIPLLVVLLTMVPQMLLLFASIQPNELRRQLVDAFESIEMYIQHRRREFQLMGRGMLSMLSRTSTQLSQQMRESIQMLEEDIDADEDYYRLARAEVAASEREIYEWKESKRKDKKSKKTKDKRRKDTKFEGPVEPVQRSNIKPSLHLEFRQDVMGSARW